MSIKNKTAALILILTCTLVSMGQVGIGTNTPNANSALDITSTSQGMFFPRMTTSERDAIITPEKGLSVFNTSQNAIQTNIGTSIAPSWKNWYAIGAKVGSSYTKHFNGISSGISSDNLLASYTAGETFNNNPSCTAKLISAQGCGDLTNITGASGTTYNLININGQCWMTSNLKERPSNFSSLTNTSWLNTSATDMGYWGYYNTTTTNGSAGWGNAEPASGEGYLYQWSAAMNSSTVERSQGVCPAGFHIPSDCEWMYLEHGQGMSITEQQVNNNWRANTSDNQGTPGNKLRSAGVGQTNASGFTALLTGTRASDGVFYSRTSQGTLWSSSASTSQSSIRLIMSGARGIYRISYAKSNAESVRCLKD